MPAPSKTQVEALTDRLAAIIQAGLTGFAAEYGAATLTTLFDQLNATGDPDIEGALTTAGRNVDRQSFPENHYQALSDLLSRPAPRAFVTALNTLVKSAPGGSYASMRAYLVDKSAKLHPLAGELFRKVLGETCFTASAVVQGVSNPTYSVVFPNRAYTGADGSLVDDTTDVTDAGTADVALFANDNETLYLGCDRKFEGIVLGLSTLSSADIAGTFQYWNGASWATLTKTDNSVGFTKAELISFTAPSDWVPSYKDSGGTAMADNARYYYIRIARTEDTVVTPPVATCITLIPVYAGTSATATTHLGIQQPPLAICRITAASTMTVTAPAAIDYTRFAHPIGSEAKIRLRALTVIAQDLTVTLAYVNDDGSNASNAQSAWTAPAALGTAVVTLADSNADGLRSVRTTSTVSTTATAGIFAVEAIPIRTPAV